MIRMKRWPKVSVVMSNYNGYRLDLVQESLPAILANDYPNLEVILIDNCSTDETVRYVLKKFSNHPKFRLIQNPFNMYSQGLNLGVKNATGKYVAFFNNDAFVDNGYFQTFINFLEKHPKVALAQGKLVSYFDHNIIDSTGETMDGFGNNFTIGQGQDAKLSFNQTADILSVSGSCSMMRRSIIESVGLFDEDYGIGYEDMDMALRCWLKGYQILYFPDAIAYHKRGATDLAPSVRPIVRWHFNKNRLATLLKNFPISDLILSLPVTLSIYLLAGLWEVVIKNNSTLGITRFTSILWLIDQFPTILRKRSIIRNNPDPEGYIRIKQLLYSNILFGSFKSFIKS